MFICYDDTQYECSRPKFQGDGDTTTITFDVNGVVNYADILNLLNSDTFYIFDEESNVFWFEATNKEFVYIDITYCEALSYKIKIKFITKGVVDDES